MVSAVLITKSPRFLGYYCNHCPKNDMCEFAFNSVSKHQGLSSTWRHCPHVKDFANVLIGSKALTKNKSQPLAVCSECKNAVFVKNFNGVYVCKKCYVSYGGSQEYWDKS